MCFNSATFDLSQMLNYILFLMPQQEHIPSCDQAKALYMARWKEEFWTGLITPEEPAVDLSIWESFSLRRFWETQMHPNAQKLHSVRAQDSLTQLSPLQSALCHRWPCVFTTYKFTIPYKLVWRACKSCLLSARRELLREENGKHRCTQTGRKEKCVGDDREKKTGWGWGWGWGQLRGWGIRKMKEAVVRGKYAKKTLNISDL